MELGSVKMLVVKVQPHCVVPQYKSPTEEAVRRPIGRLEGFNKASCKYNILARYLETNQAGLYIIDVVGLRIH